MIVSRKNSIGSLMAKLPTLNPKYRTCEKNKLDR